MDAAKMPWRRRGRARWAPREWQKKDVRLGRWALGLRPLPARGDRRSNFAVFVPRDGGPATVERRRAVSGWCFAWSRRLRPDEAAVITPGADLDRSGVWYHGDVAIVEFRGDDAAVRVECRRRGRGASAAGLGGREVAPGVEVGGGAAGDRVRNDLRGWLGRWKADPRRGRGG